MDQLQEKHFDTSRGFHYRYYLSDADTAADTSKPILLLCHGWPDGAALWQYIIPHLLPTGLRLLAPDLLGYGGTSKPTSPEHYISARIADDIVEILAAEGLASHPVIPIGHDWGSFFAQRFYMLHTVRCVGLVNLSVALLPPSGQPFDLAAINAATTQAFGYAMYAYWELFTAPDGPALIDRRLDSLWHAMHGRSPDLMRELFCTPGAMRDFLEHDRRDAPLLPYAEDERLRDEWKASIAAGGFAGPCCWYRVAKENYQLEVERSLSGRVDRPYLFIGCDGDAVCRTDAVDPPIKEGLLPDATVKEIHSNHWCPYEKPDEVAGLILEWMKEKGFVA